MRRFCGSKAVRAGGGGVSAALLTLVLLVGASSARSAVQVGFSAQSYSQFGSEARGGAITGQKPESKLWWNDGKWWAAMVSPAAGGAHTIFQLQGTTWIDTGVVIDMRTTTKEDVLSLGTTLYVVSRAPAVDGPNHLTRFRYANGAYARDPGFPVDIPGSGAETTTIARDTTGKLWITYTMSGNVWVAHSRGADTYWSAPATLGTGLDADDISAIVSFTDAIGPAVGVMWSNQVDNQQHFAVHRDGTLNTSWTTEAALRGPLEADDHISLKTFEGRVFAVVKTSQTNPADTLIKLIVRSSSGVWTAVPVARVDERNTRPITVLAIDPADRKIFVFMTMGEGPTAHGIAYKDASIDSPAFQQPPTVFIQGPAGELINDPTSTKQNLDRTSGIVVMASDTNRYWWNKLDLSAPPPANTPPSASDVSVSTVAGSPMAVTLSGSDAETCELQFAIVAQPAHGTLGAVDGAPCAAGSPNTDTATVTYTPAAGYSGPDSFGYAVNDGSAGSNTATVSVTVTAPSGTGIAFRSAGAAGNATATTLVLPTPAGVQAGDVLLAAIDVRGSPAISAPAGWTLVRSDAAGYTIKQAVYLHVAGSAEPADSTWTFASSQGASGATLAFSGVDTTTPIDASGGQVNATGPSITAPTITTTSANTMLVGIFGDPYATTIDAPGGMSERTDASSTAGTYRVTTETATQTLTTSGATGARTATAATGTNTNIGQLIALKPAG